MSGQVRAKPLPNPVGSSLPRCPSSSPATMKGKNFQGLFLSLARNTAILLVSSPLSSSSHRVICLPSLQNYTRSLSTIHSHRLSRTNNHPPCVSVPKSSYAPHSSAYLLHPDVERVCLLLCRYENPDFASLFDGFSSDFDSDLVLGVLMSYRRLNMGGSPSTFVVMDLIQGLCRLRKMDQVVKILRVAEERNLGVFYKCYPDVIKALCEVHCLEEARKMFARVLSHGLNPKLKTYKSLICAACEIGDLKEAEKLFGIMKRKRCTPDSVVYTSMIHGCCKCNEWEAAYQLSLEMLDFGWCLDVQTYTLVDMLIRTHGHVDLAVHLHAKMESTQLYKAEQLEAAYDKQSSVLTNRIHPPIFARELE